MISTYLFEHNDLVREGLKGYLLGTSFHVCAEFGSISEYSNDNSNTPPELIITGLGNQLCDATIAEFKEHINQFKDCFPVAKLVILASVAEIRLLPEILNFNAEGYILRDISRDAILNYLNLAMIGEKALPGQLALLFSSLPGETDASVQKQVDTHSLSSRENEVVQCLVLGESNKGIARRLDITESTVKGHLKIILRKLGVRNRTQAALVASKCSTETTPLISSMAA